MRVWPLALLLTAALAGCLSTDAGEDGAGSALAPAKEVRPFMLVEPVRVAAVPNNQIEAAISVSADGQTQLTCFHGLFTETSPGYASTDGGQTWARMSFPPEAGIGGDCETAIMDDGTWVFLASTVAGATVIVSEDNGTSWFANPASAIPLNGLADRPWIEAVGDELWLTYMPLNMQPGTVGFTKSTDKGETWSVPAFIGSPGEGGVTVQHSHPAIGPDGVHIAMVRAQHSLGGVRTLQLATTTDNGGSWSIEEVYAGLDLAKDWPGLAATTGGDLMAVAGMHQGDDMVLAGFHRAPNGTWSEPFTLHDGEGENLFWPWASGGTGHEAAFLVEGAPHEGTPHLWIGRVDLEVMAIQQVPVWPEPRVEFGSLDHDDHGRLHAAWVAAGDAQYVTRSA